MYSPEVFIISKRKELAIKHKKLVEALNCEVSIFSKLDEAISAIKNDEPEIIIISDTIDDTLSDFIRKIRVLTYNFRPVIIAVSKSDAMDDKLSTFEAGADDFLDESIPSKELQARINAHIRRYLENSIHPLTNFIDNKVTLKALKRSIRRNEERAVMLINISGINFYKEIYGEIAYEKALQTLAAIINSTLQKEDIIGHYSAKEFLIITPVVKAEKIAKFLTFAFDGILERFYTEFDYKNNFMLYSTESIEEKKIPLMKLSIAIIEIGNKNIENEKQALSLLFNVLKLCKNSKESCYMIDRPKLGGEVSKTNTKTRVMVMEPDSALNLLLTTSLKMQGYEVLPCENYDAFLNEFEKFAPDILILDYGNEHKKQGLYALQKLRERFETGSLGRGGENGTIDSAPDSTLKNPVKLPKIIFSTTIQDKKNILSSGADFYLPKPYDINTLLDWVKKLI